MPNRRSFIKKTVLGSAALSANLNLPAMKDNEVKPTVISTWRHGLAANEAAWEVIKNSGAAIDAVEKGVMVTEADPDNMSVGLGGRPDREGNVTLDACIMNSEGNAGSVSFLQNIVHPISVARLVMEETPHVMLSGAGALQFALEHGFKEENLLTEKAERQWKEWLKKSEYVPKANIENHDTIGLLAIDGQANLAGACTTSGMAYKYYGRVGDSPIIGAGLYVDNDFGAATATGVGELVMKTLGSFLVVELLRQGRSAQEACEEAVHRIVTKLDYKDMQVGYLAIDKAGNTGAYAVHPGFNYALMKDNENELIDADSYAD